MNNIINMTNGINKNVLVAIKLTLFTRGAGRITPLFQSGKKIIISTARTSPIAVWKGTCTCAELTACR